jgi:hypothetical protein
MYAVVERIMTLFPSTPTAPEPYKCIYTERLKCFEKLAELQKNLQSADNQYADVSTKEGKPHENARNRMETYTAQYKKEYELCEKIMKMN